MEWEKELLNNDKANTILLYNTNITNDNKIVITSFKNLDKGQYINLTGSKDPIIVVNRGNGNTGYNFKYALIDDYTQSYLVENHLNIIYSENKMEKTQLINLYKKIIKSFEHEKQRILSSCFLGIMECQNWIGNNTAYLSMNVNFHLGLATPLLFPQLRRTRILYIKLSTWISKQDFLWY